jgi:hypothetical protein
LHYGKSHASGSVHRLISVPCKIHVQNGDEIIKALAEKFVKTPSYDDIAFMTLCSEETDVLCKDISATNVFIKERCTDKELYSMSPVFEEVVKKTQSHELIQILTQRATSVHNEQYKKNILDEIESAKGYLLDKPIQPELFASSLY